MQWIDLSVWDQVAAGVAVPYLDAGNDVVLPKEWAIGLVCAGGVLILAQKATPVGRIFGSALAGLLGGIALPLYREVSQGFPHFRSGPDNIVDKL